MIKGKKAQVQETQFDIFSFIIVTLLVVVLFAGLIYAQGLITDAMHNAGLANEVNAGNPGYTNMTLAADMTFGQIDNSIQALRMVAIVYILSMAALIMITNALMSINKVWFFAYILLALLAVIFAPQVSNAYSSLLASNIFDGELQSFTASNFVLRNLPSIVLVISVIGGIFLFINLIRSPGEGNLR